MSPGVPEAWDFVRLHEINKQYLGQSLRAGRLPLWNPHVGLGRPFAADIETGTFYPPNAVFAFLSPAEGFALLTVLHGFLGGAGMLLLGRAIGASRLWSFVAALSFMLGGPLVGRLQVGQMPFTQALAYLPLLLHRARGVQDDPRVRSLALLASLSCLQLLAGHPQAWWLTILGLASFMLGRRVEWPLGPALRTMAVDMGRLAVCSLWSCGLAGVQMLPLLELIAQGNRAGASLDLARAFAMPAASLLSIVLPADAVVPVPWESLFYCGVLVGLAGLTGLARPRDRDMRGLLAMAAVALALAAGDRNPLFPVLARVLPGMMSFRAHARFVTLIALALTLAAARFLSDSSSPPPWRRLAAGGGLALLTVLAAGWAVPAEPSGASAAWLAVRCLAILAGLLLIATALHPPRWVRDHPRLAAAGVLAFVLGDLTAAAMHLKQIYAYPVSGRAEARVARELAASGLFDAAGTPPRISVPAPMVRENAGLRYGWSTYAGYGALSLERVWSYLHGVLGLPIPRVLNEAPSPAIQQFGPFPYASMNLVLGYSAREQRLIARRDADPRAYLAERWIRVSGWHDALERLRRGHDFHREPLVETDAEPAQLVPGASAASRARIRRFAPERIEVQVDGPGGGWLVLAEAWYPGWLAEVDGKPAPCLPANVWMRAVPVPAGAHEVTLRYRSRELLRGGLISTLSALALLFAVRRRGAGGVRQPRAAAPRLSAPPDTSAG